MGLLKEYIVNSIKEFLEDDEIIRYWALFAHFIEKGFGKLESRRSLDQLFDTLYNDNSRREDERGAIKYFYNYRKRQLGMPHDKEILVKPGEKIKI